MRTVWKSICPELPVSDVTATLAYFEERLGFRTEFCLSDASYAKVSRDGHEIFLSKMDGAFEAQTCMIYVEDIQASFEDMKNSGAHVLSDPITLGVGSSEFSIRLPDGHVFTFFH